MNTSSNAVQKIDEVIPVGSYVEHARSGEHGFVESHTHGIGRGATRHHVKWDNIEFDTPGGVTFDRLVVLRRAK